MDAERRSVTRPDGRNIDFLVAGPPDGLPLVLHEGTPVGLVLYPKTVQATRIRGLRVILAARPGYEGSTPRPGRRVVDVAEDTAAVLDELGADTFVMSAGPAAGRTRWPAPRPCPGAAWRPHRSPGWRRMRRRAWTGWRAWVQRTSPSSARRCAARPR